jgi:hypothetical protein
MKKPGWILLEDTSEIPDGKRVFLKIADNSGNISYAIATYDREADLFRYTARENEQARNEIAWLAVPE